MPKQVLESNPKIKLVVVEDYLEGFRLLLSQEIDAVGADRWVGAYTLQKNGIRGITIRGEPFAEKSASIAVKKGNSKLLDEINLGISKLKNDGTIKKIEDKWAPKEILFLTREQIHKAIMYVGVTLLIAVMGSALFWILSLRKQVRLKTYELTTANKELQLKIAELDSEILDRKRAEAELQHYMDRLKESNQALHEFAYIASHDLQEPLRTISSFIQLIERRYKGKLDSDADEFIYYVVDGVSRMRSLIKDLLQYSRVGTQGNPFEPTDMETIYDQVVSNLKTGIEETKALISHDLLPTLPADPSQITQLLQNLIGNGLKFRSEENPAIHISVKACIDEWLFSVSDNGIGIDQEYSERIFQIFQRLHTQEEYSGTGIGLAICKKIVERHGGRIWVESQEGVGSTFFFTIPARLQPVSPGLL